MYFGAVTKNGLFVAYGRANSFPGNIMLERTREVLSVTYLTMSKTLNEYVHRTDYFIIWCN